MGDRPVRTLTSRRRLLTRGAAVSGLAVAGAGLAPGAVRAQDGAGGRLQKVIERGKLIAGTGSTNPPWHYEDENGNLVGFDIDMAKLLAGALLLDDEATRADPEALASVTEFVVQESDARIPNLLSDKIDIVCQFMTVNPERAKQVEFTIPYYREAVTLMFKAGSPYSGTADISGKGAKVAILQNPFAESLVHTGVPDAEVLQFDSVANTILAMDSGRADAVAIDLSTAQYNVKLSPDRYKMAPESWQPQTYAFAVAPGDQRWLNWVNTALHEYLVGLDFGYYRTAYQTHFGVELPYPPAGFPVEYK
jgi:polar amino acid transport system substrate-binding protein